MKPCSDNRELIAWLTLDALDAGRERKLRAHLETCEGCRHYLAELSNVTETLAATEVRTDIQATESFHRRVAGALRTDARGPAWQAVAEHLRATLLSWRVALPVIVVAAMLIAARSVLERRPGVPSRAPAGAQAALAPKLNNDLDPSIANYTMVAKQSLEKLDELLTKQGNRSPSPTPLYTASTLPRAIAAD